MTETGYSDKRVCSLSRTFDSHLLWGHYASGWDGFAIEIDIAESSLHEVQYKGFMCCLDPEKYSPSIDARRVLSTKHPEWSYEQEWRIITKRGFFQLVLPIRTVIVGLRMKGRRLKRLERVCVEQGINMATAGIGDEGIDADRYRYRKA